MTDACTCRGSTRLAYNHIICAWYVNMLLFLPGLALSLRYFVCRVRFVCRLPGSFFFTPVLETGSPFGTVNGGIQRKVLQGRHVVCRCCACHYYGTILYEHALIYA